MRIEFTVPAVPVAQPRQKQRVMMVGGRAMASNYMPAKHPVNEFKATVRLAAREQYQGAAIAEPLAMRVVAVFPRPKALCWKSRPTPRLPKASKPDADNVAKAVMDALSGTTFVDDAQVASLHVEKWIAAGDEQPHVQVVIEVRSDINATERAQ